MRFLARCFLPIFAVWLCLFPAMTYAATIQTYKVGGSFIPVTGTAAVVLDLALMAGRMTPWVGAAITGYQLARVAIDALASDGSTVPVNILPSNVSQATQGGINWPNLGWVKDANGVWQPPATAGAPVLTLNYPGGYSSLASYCEAKTVPPEYYSAGVEPTPTSAGGCKLTYGGVVYQGPYYAFSYAATSACPAGYTASGSICNLTAASSVPYPSDGKPTVIAKADGTGFALDSRDPDNAPMSTIPTQITSTGVNNGSPFRTTISPQTGGGLTVTTELQIQNADGSTSTYRQTATVAPDGKVVDSSAANYPGSLAQQTGSTPALAPSTVSADMPTDYNREATQLQIKNNLDAIKTDLDSSQVPVEVAATDIAALDAAKAGREAFKTDIDGLAAAASPSPVATLFQPFTPSTCQPLSWTYGSDNTMGSHVYTLDLCPWVPTIQRVGAWAMYLLTAAMLFQMFTRRPEGGGD